MTLNAQSNEEVKEGNYPIVLEGKIVGTLDVSKFQDNTNVTIELSDCFLTIRQFIQLLERVKSDLSLSDDQGLVFTKFEGCDGIFLY